MRRDLETYRIAREQAAPRSAPIHDNRAHFLGTKQDAALTRRLIGGVLICTMLVGASLLLAG